ncbi:MAG: cyanophycinase [Nitriliruptoraceae bacterium]|jgi:cyanophycinase
MSPSPVAAGDSRGYLIPIGGAEDHDTRHILKRVVALAGGAEARIAVIPTASRMRDTGARYVEVFDELGVADAVSLPMRVRSDGNNERYVKELERATCIFITGGDQLRLSTILGGTEVFQTIRRVHSQGTHVAGTSAGAGIVPEHMLAGGDTGPTPSVTKATLAPGLGLTNKVIIDQHFTQRDRLGRLLTAISYNPFMVGLGIDEDTAAFIAPDQVLEVVGSGAITVVDPQDLDHSSMAEARSGDPVSLIDLRLHVLAEGCRFDLVNRTASLS